MEATRRFERESGVETIESGRLEAEVRELPRRNAVLAISEVRLRLVDNPRGSLIGWASCVLNDALALNNIEIRRSREGRIFLAFPFELGKSEKRHFFFNPISREASRVFEGAILNRLPAHATVSG